MTNIYEEKFSKYLSEWSCNIDIGSQQTDQPFYYPSLYTSSSYHPPLSHTWFTPITMITILYQQKTRKQVIIAWTLKFNTEFETMMQTA